MRKVGTTVCQVYIVFGLPPLTDQIKFWENSVQHGEIDFFYLYGRFKLFFFFYSQTEQEKRESRSNMFWMEALKQNSARWGGGMTGVPFFKQMFWRSQHRIEFVLHSIPAPPPNLHGADGTFFTIHALLVFSLSAIPCLETSRARSPPSPSLFVLSEKKKSACLPVEPPLFCRVF